MPEWAQDNPNLFWQCADEFERKNGSTYREIEIALPRELTLQQRKELVQTFVEQELGEKHAYTWAIHNPKASIEGGEQPHAHIMYSERLQDGIERSPDQFLNVTIVRILNVAVVRSLILLKPQNSEKPSL